jgi:hypothetical protein
VRPIAEFRAAAAAAGIQHRVKREGFGFVFHGDGVLMS